MSTWTITTTADEDEAIHYSYQLSQKPVLGVPPLVETEAEYFERMTRVATIGPMVTQYSLAQQEEVRSMLASIPPENRPAAAEDLKVLVEEHGGTVPLHEARYLWSASTAPPPRDNSVEVDATDANFAQVTKMFFDHLDADQKNLMTNLMTLVTGTVIRLEDPATAANFLEIMTTAAPIQRQGADGHVELLVAFQQRGGSFATLDTQPLTVTFS